MFHCPNCRTKNLAITLTLELPSDSRSDEITVQIVVCGQCDFRGAAVYEESRRGELESESWEHVGFHLDERALTVLKEAIQDCPYPDDPDCTCPTHRDLGETDVNGRWMGLPGTDWKRRFPINR